MTQTRTSLKRSSLILPDGQHKYPPSWLDRFFCWVDSLPISPWLLYALIGMALMAIELAINWFQGDEPVGTIHFFHVVFVFSVSYGFAAIHYLDREAGKAIDRFRPALTVNAVEYRELRYRFTTMHPRPVWLATAAGVFVFIAMLITTPLDLRLRLFQFVNSDLSLLFNDLVSLVVWILCSVGTYHSFHQLRMVSYIYTKYTRINLFEQRPLYALSGLTARTSILWIIVAWAWYASVPGLTETFVSGFAVVLWVVVAVIMFVWPLMGIHNLLLEAKDRVLFQNRQRLEALVGELHQRIDREDLAQMDNFNKALASIELEFGGLQRIPTWPWHPEAVRGVVAALIFPLVLWIMQQFLERIV